MRILDLIDEQFVERLAARGALILDVDDTLLARRGGTADGGETFSDSEAAMLLPCLARSGVRVALVTGHGAEQLSSRLLRSLAAELVSVQHAPGFEIPVVYANRGATHLTLVDGKFVSSPSYGAQFQIRGIQRLVLETILREISAVEHNDPVMELRDDVILSLRPISANLRPGAIDRGKELLQQAGLEAVFEVEPAGKTTIEISRRGLTKSVGCSDVLASVSERIGLPQAEVETLSLMIGDEFGLGGNDRAIAVDFPNLSCVSVANTGVRTLPRNVVEFDELSGLSSTEATVAVLRQMLNVLDMTHQSVNLKR